jgi:anti-anti-sigma regulatory factor
MATDVPSLDLTVHKTPRCFTLGIAGSLDRAAVPALVQTLEEIEAERYADVTLDLTSVERIDLPAVRALAGHATRAIGRELSVRIVPSLPTLYLETVVASVRAASEARRALIELHRASLLEATSNRRGEMSAAILHPERRLRDTCRAILEAVVDLRTDPILLRPREDDPDPGAWRRVARLAGAAGRSDRELHACFLEISAMVPQVRAAADLVVRALTRSIAADDALRDLAGERLENAAAFG